MNKILENTDYDSDLKQALNHNKLAKFYQKQLCDPDINHKPNLFHTMDSNVIQINQTRISQYVTIINVSDALKFARI